MDILQATGLCHRLLEGVFDNDHRGPDGLLVIPWISGKVAEKGPEGIGAPGIVFEFQVYVPKTTLMADGRQVVPLGRGGRSLFVR